MTGAPALKDVGAVCPVLVAADPAAQDVDELVVVCASKMCRPNHNLPVSIPIARFRRPLAHSGEYTGP
jgi:hypothetical protein